MKPDQVNMGGRTRQWANLMNDVRQDFTPSLPRLIAVEVGLTVADPGPRDVRITLSVFDANGHRVASDSESVPVDKCDHALFVLSRSGIEVTPGQNYTIRLSGGSTLGWKYVRGGYEQGDATFNGRPLVPGMRCTFLFRTFGTT